MKTLASGTTPVDSQRELTEDATDGTRRHDALTIAWQPQWRLFPSFRGLATVRPQAPGAVLTLEGSYIVPGGLIGQAFDSLIGERLAYSTLNHLLDELAGYIEHRHRAFAKAHPVPQS